MKAARLVLLVAGLAVAACASVGMMIAGYYGSAVVAIRSGYGDGSLVAALAGLGVVVAVLVPVWWRLMAALRSR